MLITLNDADNIYIAKNMKSSHEDFEIFYQNARGLNTKANICFNNSLNISPPIIIITETWLHSGRSSHEFFDLNIYKVFRKDRVDLSKSSGGGVLIAIKKSLLASEIDLPMLLVNQFNMIEFLGVRVKVNNIPLNIFVVYIPSLSINIINSFLDELSDCILEKPGETVMFGDFNCPDYFECMYLPGKQVNCDKYTTIIHDFSAVIGFKQYSRVGHSNNRLLDLVLSTLKCSVARSIEVLVPLDADHHPALVASFNFSSSHLNYFIPNSNNGSFNFMRADLNYVEFCLSKVD